MEKRNSCSNVHSEIVKDLSDTVCDNSGPIRSIHLKRGIVTPAVYLCFLEFLHFDIQSTIVTVVFSLNKLKKFLKKEHSPRWNRHARDLLGEIVIKYKG